MRKLDAEAEASLARAREEARRRRHAEVRPEHVMSALFKSVAVWNALVELAIDPKDLKDRVEGALARIDEVGGYRGAALDPPISAELEVALGRAAALTTIPLLSRVRVEHVFHAVIASRSVAKIVLELRANDDSAEAVVTRARALAALSGHAFVTPTHVLRALLDTDAMARAVVRAGGDLERVRNRLDTELAYGAPERGLAVISDALEVVLESVRRTVQAKTTSMKPRDVLALRLLQDEGVVMQLAEWNVDAFDVVHLLVHDAPPLDVEPNAAGDAILEVVFHNDDFTTREIVTECLVEAFDRPEPEAYQLMLRVHEEGLAVAGRWPAREARERRHRAIVRARSAGAPLRITLRRPGT